MEGKWYKIDDVLWVKVSLGFDMGLFEFIRKI